jgi:hypothetical protein
VIRRTFVATKGQAGTCRSFSFRAGTNLVLLDPDVAKAFPDEAAVNEALRVVIRLSEIQRGEEPGLGSA